MVRNMKFDCLIIDDEKLLADNTCEYFNMFDVRSKAVYSKKEAELFDNVWNDKFTTDGKLLYKNAEGVSVSLNEAVKNGDTILDITNGDTIAARLLIRNKSAEAFDIMRSELKKSRAAEKKEKYGDHVVSAMNFFDTLEGNMTTFKDISTLMLVLLRWFSPQR